jgi:hypothetical protein
MATKYLGQTPLMKWNPLKTKSIILVIGNIIKDKFLSLHRNLASFYLSLSLSLSPLIKKGLKN